MVTTLITGKRSELDLLCRRFGVRRLEVFGSASTERFDPAHSDLDFLVEFEPATSGFADRYFGLLEAMEDLFGREVDLLESPAMRNPYFIRQIAPTRVVLYAA